MKKKLLSLLAALLFFSSAMWAQTTLQDVSFSSNSLTTLQSPPKNGTKDDSPILESNEEGCMGVVCTWKETPAGQSKAHEANLVFWFNGQEGYMTNDGMFYTLLNQTGKFPPCGDYLVCANATKSSELDSDYYKEGYVTGVSNTGTNPVYLYVSRWEWGSSPKKYALRCAPDANHYIHVRKGSDGKPYVYFSGIPTNTTNTIFGNVSMGAGPASDANAAATLTISMDDASKGSVSVSKPTTGVLPQGDNTIVTTTKYFWVTVEVTPKEGETFYGWSDGTPATENPRHVYMNEVNKTITACFTQGSVSQPKTTISSDAHATITATVNGGAITIGEEYEAENGTEIALSCTPTTGYAFRGWYSGSDLLSEDANYTYTVNGNKTITAKVVVHDFIESVGMVPLNYYGEDVSTGTAGYNDFIYQLSFSVASTNITYAQYQQSLCLEAQSINDRHILLDRSTYNGEHPVRVAWNNTQRVGNKMTFRCTYYMADGAEHEIVFHYYFMPNKDLKDDTKNDCIELVNVVYDGGMTDFIPCNPQFTAEQTTYGESYVKGDARIFPVTCTQTDADGVKWEMVMRLIADKDAKYLPAGEYTIDTTGVAGTALAPTDSRSTVGDASGSYLTRQGNGEPNTYLVHFCNGKVTVTDGEGDARGTVTINGTSIGCQPITATLPAPEKASALVLNDNENNAPVLSANVGKEQDIQLMRTFQAGMWNTVCLPFALDASQIATAFGEGTQVGSMTRGETVEDELFLNFDTKETTMVAGQPYIIFPGDDANVVNPTFENVTITTTEAETYLSPTGDVIFTGAFSPVANLKETDYYLGVNNTIHSTISGTLKGFRAYFNYFSQAGSDAPKRVRMSINGTETTTAMDEMEVLNPAEKMIENGQVVIIKNGAKYNVFGQQL
ncbi:MAG: InlB B-repeat-containing protein [Paludibacteraceae bacterium]|nr:InlB B-repeat-containing protein [Paludibacteraceae bacterium]